jgi:hypothetical protein
VCCNVRLIHSSICIIGNSAERIKESAKSGTKVINERTSYSRSSTMKHVENFLSNWIEDQNLCHRPISKFLVEGKACSVCEDLEGL